MPTDWKTVRAMMNAAIDACESTEHAGYTEHHRAITVNDAGATVFDAMTSAWALPESMRYRIIRERHDAGMDSPYVPETARILVAMAQAAAELIGAKSCPTLEQPLNEMIDWYKQVMPAMQRAIQGKGPDKLDGGWHRAT